MNHPIVVLIGSAALVLSGCGGTAPVADIPATDGAGAAESTDSSPPGDAEGSSAEGQAGAEKAAGGGESSAAAEPPPPAPKTRMEQCQVLGTGMQQVQKVGPIVNAGDTDKLRAMAKDLRVEAETLAKPKLSNEKLAALRDQYVKTTNEMAVALETAAASGVATEQKASVETFRKLEPTLNDHIEKLNEICNSPGR